MGQYTRFTAAIKSSKPLPPGCKMETTSVPLMQNGFNLPVAVSTSSMMQELEPERTFKTIVVMAHFDTGASNTMIDPKVAEFLELKAVGMSRSHTAGGPIEMPKYAIDVIFPGTELRQFTNLEAGSCQLPFNPDQSSPNFLSNSNFGVLIGRDIMARWNIVWNGPTSTVIISD